MSRMQKQQILEDLSKKMVFITGPRQVGKTWLAQNIAENFTSSIYLNYDSLKDKEIILNQSWIRNTELLIFDEIHKMPDWKNYIKGVYDTKSLGQKIIVTGSARFDLLKDCGDSLAGRFFLHQIFPFSPYEIKKVDIDNIDLEKLILRGGFPEPLFSNIAEDADRWRNQYINGLIREDILMIDKISNLNAIEILLNLLRSRVGSTVSFSSLARDLAISVNSVKKYLNILEVLFITFKVTPYSKNIARSVLKEPKFYFYDLGMLSDNKGASFENLLALSLYQYVVLENLYKGKSLNLGFLRTKEGKEVDFVISDNNRIIKIIEAKYSDSNLSQNLSYFANKYQLPSMQIIYNLDKSFEKDGTEIFSAQDFLYDINSLLFN